MRDFYAPDSVGHKSGFASPNGIGDMKRKNKSQTIGFNFCNWDVFL